MLLPTPWFKRKFGNINDTGLLPGIIERLAGTHARLSNQLREIPKEILIETVDDKWSIQENVGHLLNLEPLWLGRVDDIASGAKILREADLTNSSTYKSQYNFQALPNILDGFGRDRNLLVAKLRGLEPEVLKKISLHPRLLTPMTIMDLSYFIAEHDDHHLATITCLMEELNYS